MHCDRIWNMKHRNTLQKGSARAIVFREGDTWYGACLEFNIIESGTNPREALLLLLEAVEGYLESARKIKARPQILNQKPDAEYEKMWSDLRQAKKPTGVDQVYFSGELNISRRPLVSA